MICMLIICITDELTLRRWAFESRWV